MLHLYKRDRATIDALGHYNPAACLEYNGGQVLVLSCQTLSLSCLPNLESKC